jgi:hypothetical protein
MTADNANIADERVGLSQDGVASFPLIGMAARGRVILPLI